MIGILMLLFSLCLLAGCSHKVIITAETYTLEAGTELPESPETYASFSSAELAAEAIVQADQVDTGKVGTYEAAVVLNGKAYPFAVEVVDTRAPEGSLGDWFVLSNEAVMPDSFLSECTDASEVTTGFRNIELLKGQEELAALFQQELTYQEDFLISDFLGLSWEFEKDSREEQGTELENLVESLEAEEDGLYSLELVAADEYGNASVIRCYALIDRTAPILSGVEDTEIALNRNTDVDTLTTDGVSAEDNLLGDITASILIEEEILESSDTHLKAKVTYTVTDLCGNVATAERVMEMAPEKQTTGYTPTNMSNVLVIDGNVQNAALVYEGLNLIPINLLHKFLADGWQIVLTDQSMQAFGHAANVGAATYWKNHMIVIPDSQGAKISTILVHEMGHVLGGYAGTPSSSAEFEAIYAEEKDAFGATGGLNKTNAYSSIEFFAQVFCDIYTTGHAKSVAPKAYEFVLRYVNSM